MNYLIDHAKEAWNKGHKLQNVRTLQFFSQFLFFSKYGEDSEVFQEFLIAAQAIKLVLRITQFYKHPNIYMEKYFPQPPSPKESPNRKPSNKFDRIRALLQKIKSNAHAKVDHQPQAFEELPSGKRIQLITSVSIPSQLKRSRLRFWQLVGEFLMIVRPFFSILAIRAFGQNSYKPYLLSLLIDLVVLWLQRDLKLLGQKEELEMEGRKKDLIYRYLFKKPFYYLLKDKFILPFLRFFMNDSRFFFKIIMYIVQIQTTLTLTI